jgi:Leucine-rich repeat (LRR) protein
MLWIGKLDPRIEIELESSLKRLNARVQRDRMIYGHPIVSVKLEGIGLSDELFDLLDSLEHLATFEIRGIEMTRHYVERISRWTQLRYLSLIDTALSGADLASLAGLFELRMLDLSRNHVEKDLGFIEKLSSLQDLSLAATAVNDQALGSLVLPKRVEKLDISATRVTDKSLASLAAFPIQELAANSTMLGGSQFKEISRIDSLVSLSLANARLNDSHLHHLKGLSELKSLVLSKNNISAEGVSRSLPENLESLNLAGNNLGDSELVLPRKLKALNLALCELKNLKSTNLDRLNLKNVILDMNSIIDEDLAVFVSSTDLAALSIGRTSISGVGLSQIKNPQGLVMLSVAGNRMFGDAELQSLRRFKRLRALNISGTSVSDKGISSLLSLNHLAALNVQNTEVTSDGLEILDALTLLKRVQAGR